MRVNLLLPRPVQPPPNRRRRCRRMCQLCLRALLPTSSLEKEHPFPVSRVGMAAAPGGQDEIDVDSGVEIAGYMAVNWRRRSLCCRCFSAGKRGQGRVFSVYCLFLWWWMLQRMTFLEVCRYKCIRVVVYQHNMLGRREIACLGLHLVI